MKLYKIWKRGKIIKSPYLGLYAGIVTMGIFGKLDCKNCKPEKLNEEEKKLRRLIKTRS